LPARAHQERSVQALGDEVKDAVAVPIGYEQLLESGETDSYLAGRAVLGVTQGWVGINRSVRADGYKVRRAADGRRAEIHGRRLVLAAGFAHTHRIRGRRVRPAGPRGGSGGQRGVAEEVHDAPQ